MHVQATLKSQKPNTNTDLFPAQAKLHCGYSWLGGYPGSSPPTCNSVICASINGGEVSEEKEQREWCGIIIAKFVIVV